MRKLSLGLMFILATSGSALAGHGFMMGGMPPMMPGGMPPWDISKIDTNGDDRISNSEMTASLTADFASADANSDTTLSVAELVAFEEKRKAEMVTTAFNALDSDTSGSVTLAEFQANDITTNAKKISAALFGLADSNADEALSSGEYAILHTETGRAWGHFAYVDTDGDGSVSQAEFLDGAPPMTMGHSGFSMMGRGGSKR